MKVIGEIHKRLPNTHIVMHGSSSVPELQAEFNHLRRRHEGNLWYKWKKIVKGIKVMPRSTST